VVVGPDERWTPPAAVVAAFRPLDLDDAGAEVGQHHGRMGPGQRPGEVDDDDVGKRSSHAPTLFAPRVCLVDGANSPSTRQTCRAHGVVAWPTLPVRRRGRG